MKKYLGVKIIKAAPLSENAWLINQGRLIGTENIDGYLVEYEDGYQSWSPKEVFKKAYREIDGLTFGLAVEALKMGKKVARAGWNGKGMWLKLIANKTWALNIEEHSELVDGANGVNSLPWIGMKTADNKFVPWLASQTDILAEDWTIVEQDNND